MNTASFLKYNIYYKRIIESAEKISNDKLFSKNAFAWVAGSTLSSYFVSTTSSHYDWAMKKTKNHTTTQLLNS